MAQKTGSTQFEHLLAKCKQIETGSSPTTGVAASKNNPVTQQHRNSAQMVTSSAESSCQRVKGSNHFSTCTDLFCPRKYSSTVQRVGILFTITIRERVGMCCLRSAGGSVQAAWETVITFPLLKSSIHVQFEQIK